jgi:hypothetical protein
MEAEMKRWVFDAIGPLAIVAAGCGSDDPTQVPVPTVPRSGLVAEYMFSGNPEDTSGNANHGLLLGGPTLTSDRFGTANAAYLLDGIDDAIATTNDTYSAANRVSVSAWFKLPSAAAGLDYFASCNDFGLWTREATAGIAIHAPATNSAQGVFTTAGVWHHLLGTYDGIDIRCYLDGVLVQTTNHPGTLGDLNRPLVFGSFAGHWNGFLDDVRIYNRAIAIPAEISALYHERGYAQ